MGINKFRVWCLNNKEWEKDKVIITDEGNLYQIDYTTNKLFPLRKDTHIVQFYTGEHDDNGVEICEGDIVMCKDYSENEYTSVIEYEQGAFLVDVNGCDYDQTAIGRAIDSDIESIKVIGNRFDNIYVRK